MARVLLVDGTFELYRAHYSPRPSRVTADGRDVKATAGVLASIRWLVKDSAGSSAARERSQNSKDSASEVYLGIAFDNPIRSFRNDLFDGYKSDAGVPPELRDQFDLVEEAMRALGVCVWSMRDFEADDAIATAAKALSGQGHQIRILSPDKDMGQCLLADDIVQVDRIRKTEWGADGVRQKLGIEPAQIPDYLALVGDTADGIPGLPGFGPKAAAALLGAFGTLDAIPDQAAAWPKSVRGKERLAPAFAAARADVALYRTLATLRTDAPIPTDLESLRVPPVDEAVLAAFEATIRGASK